MAFPGHKESLRLRRLSQMSSGSQGNHDERPGVSKRRSAHVDDIVLNYADSELSKSTSENKTRPPEAVYPENGLVDDHGNKPTRSLWIGNLPPNLPLTKLREGFSEYGAIESARVLPTSKYTAGSVSKTASSFAFVNFNHVESAERAWRACHEQEIFQKGKRLYVRFTGSQTEARQNKENDISRRISSDSKAPPLFTRVSHTSANSDGALDEADTSEIVWPNGPPPKGPKSHQREVSPPPLRRGDSYRPSDTSDHGGNRGGHRESLSERANWRSRPSADVYRPSYNGSSPRPYSRRRRDSLARSDSSMSTLSSHLDRDESEARAAMTDEGDASPLPWERLSRKNLKSGSGLLPGNLTDNLVTVKEQPVNKSATTDQLACKTIEGHSQVDGPAVEIIATPARTVTPVIQENNEDDDPYSPRLEFDSMEPGEHSADLSDRSLEDIRGLGAKSSDIRTQPSFSTSLMVSPNMNMSRAGGMGSLKKLRHFNDETSSVISDHTSSSRASLRRKICADCKKVESTLMPLTSCRSCPRRFHDSCGNPRPSTAATGLFVCGKCLRRLNLRGTPGSSSTAKRGDVPNILSLDGPTSVSDKHFSLPSTSVSHNHEIAQSAQGNVVMNLPPQQHTQETSRDVAEEILPSPSKHNNTVLDEQKSAYAFSEKSLRPPTKTAISQKKVYEQVTCPWWKKSSGCHLEPQHCMFAHRDTGLESPDGFHPAKDWTCPLYDKPRGCPNLPTACLYAHKDTGLYVGVNGRASLKHITCHYWFRRNSSCKHSPDKCIFAHENTGIYSNDPADKKPGGMATMWIPELGSEHSAAEVVQQIEDSVPDTYLRKNWDLQQSTMRLSRQDTAENSVLLSHENPKEDQLSKLTSTIQETFSGTVPTVGVPTLSSVDEKISAPIRHMARRTGAIQDPRKLKRQLSSRIDTETLDEGLDNGDQDCESSWLDVATTNKDEPEPLDSPSGQRMRRCENCNKTIFNGSLCVGCTKKSVSNSTTLTQQKPAVTIAAEPSVPPVTAVSCEEGKTDLLEDPESLMMAELREQTQQARTKPVVPEPIVSLKRVTSNDHLFLSSKRRKLSMSCMVQKSGSSALTTSIRPQTYVTESRPVDKVVEVAKPPTLQDLIREERKKKATEKQGLIEEGNDEPIPDSAAGLESPTLDEAVSPKPGVPTDTQETSQDQLQSQGDSTLLIQTITDDRSTQDLCEQILPTAESSIAEPSIVREIRETVSEIKELSKGSLPTASSNFSDFRSRSATKDPKDLHNTRVDVQDTPVDKTNCDWSRKHQRCHHRPATNCRTESFGNTINEACYQCRARHKKCLHDRNGDLDGKKCYDWLESRTNSTTTDRARAEFWAIKTAAEEYELSFKILPGLTSRSLSVSDNETWLSSTSGDDPAESTTNTEIVGDAPASPLSDHLKSSTVQYHFVPTPIIDTTGKSFVPDTFHKSTERSTLTPSDGFTEAQERHHLASLKARGVMIESDNESDYEEVPQFNVRPKPIVVRELPIDPLYQRPKTASNPYEIDKSLQSRANDQYEQVRITKGAGLKHPKRVLRRQLQDRQERFGNPHRMVDRKLDGVTVTALVERRVAPRGAQHDFLAVESLETKRQKMTFAEFLGIPDQVEACLMREGGSKVLAFRESKSDCILGEWGRRKRTTESEKWPVVDK